MFLATITMVHTAESLEELNRDTKAIQGTALENLCQIGVLKFQQIDGLNTVLPAGGKHISINRTLTTEALTAFMPFRVQEVQHEHGIYYGQNVKSKNMILADRRKLLNGNSFILGVSGSGKSFAAKSEITNIMLSTDADIIIVDPEREYAPLVRELGGEVVEISATSHAHINAMDMHKYYGEVNPVIEKSQFLQSHTARAMLSNSEFIILLNQAAINRAEFANLLNISDNQLSYITNVEAGKGLLKVGNTLVPFENHFPKKTNLYRLMTTKPGEHADGD